VDDNGPLDGAQQHYGGIRADASAVERSNAFLAFDGWEIEGQKCIMRMAGVARVVVRTGCLRHPFP
jgi:hypothetical protein